MAISYDPYLIKHARISMIWKHHQWSGTACHSLWCMDGARCPGNSFCLSFLKKN